MSSMCISTWQSAFGHTIGNLLSSIWSCKCSFSQSGWNICPQFSSGRKSCGSIISKQICHVISVSSYAFLIAASSASNCSCSNLASCRLASSSASYFFFSSSMASRMISRELRIYNSAYSFSAISPVIGFILYVIPSITTSSLNEADRDKLIKGTSN